MHKIIGFLISLTDDGVLPSLRFLGFFYCSHGMLMMITVNGSKVTRSGVVLLIFLFILPLTTYRFLFELNDKFSEFFLEWKCCDLQPK